MGSSLLLEDQAEEVAKVDDRLRARDEFLLLDGNP
jgi:hypothetical protein